MPLPDVSYDLAVLIRRACHLEVLARKPGNVHPGASFVDLTCDDLLRSADAIAPVLAQTVARGIGPAVLAAVEATRAVAASNSNLGMVLLFAPLVAVPRRQTLRDGIGGILLRTTVDDARFVYRAICLASPGGLGRVSQQDVRDEPTQTLADVMRLAADRDRVAAQYATDFRDVLDLGVPLLLDWSRRTCNWETAVIGLHLSLMARTPDTLVARKCGQEAASESAARAQNVLDQGWPETAAGTRALSELDAWLRADGHRRNPGTTADLVAATLFAAMRDHGWVGPIET
jgi:triphosphoribosyl-dephospho-CoA synthase